MKISLSAVMLAVVTAGSAHAADLGEQPHVKARTMIAATYDWSGFYAGVNAGGAKGYSGAATTTLDPPLQYFVNTSTAAVNAAGAQRVSSSGFTGGLTAGYNWQAGSAVFGVEADFDYFGLKGSAARSGVYPCCAPATFSVSSSLSTDWLFTLRPRVGLASDTWLFYVTGGLALTDLKASFAFVDAPPAGISPATESGTFSKTKAGWTAGAGIEHAVANGWSVKAEYLYVDFGRESTTSNNLGNAFGTMPQQTFRHEADLHTHVLRAGLNYRFGGPGTAKY